MTFLADRLFHIHPSPTLAMNARAAQLKAEGINVISLSAGEPDFDTPDFIKDGAKKAIDLGFTKYTAVDGVPDLKKAIQAKFLNDNGLSYTLNEITVGNGGKQILFNALIATLNPDDEVIICAPYWVSYPDIVHLFSGKPVVVACQEAHQFKITAAQLSAAITPKTKWLILNSPSNPTGELYSATELEEIAIVLRQHSHVHILSDDIYEYLVYNNQSFTSILSVAPDLKERTLLLNGVSKSYAMTGWRIGYGAGPAPLIKAMSMLQSQSTSNASSISQAAAITALTHNHDFMSQWREVFQRRRDLCVQAFNEIPGLSCRCPSGAFYLYINCADLMGKKTPQGNIISTDTLLAEYLLDAGRVAVVSGEAFGLSPYFRISYATSDDLLIEAAKRIRIAIHDLL